MFDDFIRELSSRELDFALSTLNFRGERLLPLSGLNELESFFTLSLGILFWF